MRLPTWLRPLVARPNRNLVRRAAKRPIFRPRVETLEDRTTPAIFTVSNVDDGGAGSLRQAILDANAMPGADSIIFALPNSLKSPGGDWWTIQPLSALPAVTDPVTIDGWSQAGAGPGLAPRVVIDGTNAGAGSGLDLIYNCTVRGLALGNFIVNPPGNLAAGIALDGTHNTVVGCYLGLDPTGTTAAPNVYGIADYGVGNTIGGSGPGEGNVISGNGKANVFGGNGVTIGNFIGTNSAGTAAIPGSASFGILAADGMVAHNLISGNGDAGIAVEDTNHLRIVGNLIGTDVTGMRALGNGPAGIFVQGGADVIIGGTDPSSRNVISGNVFGIFIQSPGVVVQGNYIGTDVTGAPTLGNHVGGISVGGSACLIGGAAAGAGNLIADNARFGIDITGAGNQVVGNVIWLNGLTGGTGEGAVIVRNNSAVGNSLLENAIFSNASLGIDLGDDHIPTLNDSAGHDGPNHFQNFPVLTAAHCGAAAGTLSSTPNTTFRIEFFGNAQADPSGYGEGQTFLGSACVTTDAAGNASFTADLPDLLSDEPLVSATATNLSTGDTSEFSQTITIAAKSDQTITPDWPTRSLGANNVTLNLTSTSGLPVSYTVSGPATFDANNVLTITGLGTVTITAHQAGDDCYNPAPDISHTYAVAPASLCGILFKDFNEDGFQDYGELGAAGINVQLTGNDFNGAAVSVSATTGTSGYFQFANLLPGSYTVSIPGGLTVTKITVGLNGSPPAVVGSSAGLAIVEGTTQNVVNFGLEPAAGDALHHGETAGIGFWNNKNGQALIKSLNGGAGAQLANWLAATFPHMFGAAGHDLTGGTDAAVAAYFQTLFATKGDKLEAQVLATALSVYVTNSTLAGGGYAATYGFTVVANGGTGLATFNVGSDGAAVGHANGTTMTIMDILLAVDQHATHTATAAGFVLYSGDQAKRGLADDLFGEINDLGDI